MHLGANDLVAWIEVDATAPAVLHFSEQKSVASVSNGKTHNEYEVSD
jgi:hypothetical protein